ncbi:MAG TPA: DUF503 domain-containing protein [Myxococcota bacterium]|nr:DUF503 domain-containing protein [Myxococcota bacterium]
MNIVRLGVLRAVLSVPGARSLKDRRQVVRSLRDRIVARFPVSCHEIDRSDLPGRAELLVTTGGLDAPTVRGALDKISAFLQAQGACMVVDLRVQVLEWTGDEADGVGPWWRGDDV